MLVSSARTGEERMMMNPEAFLGPQDPLVPEAADDDFTDGTFPAEEEQPETQGEDPLEAEIGEDGQGDLDLEDEGSLDEEPTDLRDGSR
jgi:hypothetical protein